MSSLSAVTIRELSFSWPDGTVALDRLNGTFTRGRTGLVGVNGSGKSTLLRLIAGKLRPQSGQIDCGGDVGYLPQTLTLDAEASVADLLGIAPILAAIAAIESGDIDERHFDTIGEDWDIASRAAEALSAIALDGIELSRRVGEVSGGEAMLIALTGLRLRRPAITLLDEPTNNLDRATRERLGVMVESWPGTLIVVSHDRELLERMEHTAELHAGTISVFGGPYSAWCAYQEGNQAAALQAARSAQQALNREKRTRQEAEQKLAQRARTAKKSQRDGGIPKILVGMRVNRAEGSAGALRTTLDDRISSAQSAVDAADARVRETEHIHLTLPDPEVARGRRIAEFRDGDRTVIIQGPERVALVGPNGSGKTSLLEQLIAGTPSAPGRVHGQLLTDRVGYLPQRLDGLAEDRSALDNVAPLAPGIPTPQLRNQLARLLLRGSAIDRPVRTLSGGERFRVSLARLLFAEPPAQLLILDEPTNNLDLASVEQLAESLDAYRGALLIVSHDELFLDRLGIDTVLELTPAGRLR